METRKVTVLPDQRVRYGWRMPSMSRRGGVRLRITDGIVPYGEQLCHIRTRDKAGNKLSDVIDPRTGLCIGTTSPLESRPSNGPGVSGSHNAETLRGTAYKVEHKGQTLYHGEYEAGQAVVFRTVADGDAPLSVTRVHRPTKPVKEKRAVKRDGRTGQPAIGNGNPLPGGTGKDGRITRADCISYVKGLARGRNIEITEDMIKTARLAIKAKQAEMIKKGR